MKTKFKCQQCLKEVELDTVFKFEVCPECRGNLFPLDGIQGECGMSEKFEKLLYAALNDEFSWGASSDGDGDIGSTELDKPIIEFVNALESQLAECNVLIKKFVDTLEELMDGFEIEGDAKLDGLLAEYRATVSRAENIINESAE